MLIKSLYTVFIGLLLATCVGVGIAAFYSKPVPPATLYTVPYATDPAGNKTQANTAELKQADEQQAAYQTASERYNRNVSLLAVGFSLVILVVSLLLLGSVELIANGIMLGGVFTLIYGLIRSFASGNQKFMFVVVTFGLLVALILGYVKLIKAKA